MLGRDDLCREWLHRKPNAPGTYSFGVCLNRVGPCLQEWGRLVAGRRCTWRVDFVWVVGLSLLTDSGQGYLWVACCLFVCNIYMYGCCT